MIPTFYKKEKKKWYSRFRDRFFFFVLLLKLDCENSSAHLLCNWSIYWSKVPQNVIEEPMKSVNRY